MINAVSSVKANAQTFLRINIPQKRVSHFVTRRTLLADIADRLFNADSTKPVVLLGMGGAGKTQLALELCRQAEENDKFGAIIWVDASSRKSVIQSYRLIAEKILRHQSQDLDAGDTLRLEVQDALQHWDRQWLMVFDNYDDPQAFEGHSIRSFVPGGKSGRILFTSRLRDSARLGCQIDVSSMTENESLDLLLQRPPLSENELVHGRKIASTLGFLALALDQAGAYIRARSLDLEDFIQHYHDRKEIVLQEIPDEWEYSRSVNEDGRETRLRVFTTWELSFNQISGQGQELMDKEHFLTLAAFFDPSKISERYFQVYFKKSDPSWMRIFSSSDRWDSYRLGDVLSELQRLSLLQIRNPTSGDQSFTFHPVVCEWIKLRKSIDVQHVFTTELTIALTNYLEDIDLDLLSLEARQETHRHLDSCLLSEKRQSPLSSQVLDTLPHSLEKFADFYCDQGRYDEAKDLFGRAVAVRRENSDATQPETLQAMAGLVGVYTHQGLYDEAEKLQEQIVYERKMTFGDTHSESLRALENLGSIYGNQGRSDEAKRFLTRALKENPGLRHKILQIDKVLALFYLNQDRFDEAGALLTRILEEEEDYLDETHLGKLRTMNNLALVFDGQRQYDKAGVFFERASIGYKERLGDTHPNTLNATLNLAMTYNNQGRYEEAKELIEQTLTGKLKNLDARHRSTFDLLMSLARCNHVLDQYPEAIALYKQALAGYMETLGATHHDTLDIVESLASCHYKLGQHEDAKNFYKRAMAGRLERLGAKHSKSLRVVERLACCHYELGQHGEAKKFYERAMAGHLETLGPNHSNTLRVAGNLAICHQELGQYEEAKIFYERAMAGRLETLGATHDDTVRVVENLAYCHQELGQYEEAIKLYKMAMAGRLETLGADHSKTLWVVENLAYCHQELGQHEEVEELEKRFPQLAQSQSTPVSCAIQLRQKYVSFSPSF